MMSARRGTAITAIANGLPPAALLVTQILVAHRLGVTGRGTVAAATAPLLFAGTLFTLGLPESLTYFIAQRGAGRLTRQFGISLLALTISGAIGTALIVVFARPLSAGNEQVASLMMIGSAALVPALWTGAFRGVAYGAHSWSLVLAERSLGAILQLGLVGGLFIVGSLTPMSATLAIAATTFAGSAVYLFTPRWWAALSGPGNPSTTHAAVPQIVSYAWRVWVGSMAGIILVRFDQVMMTPLAGVEQLGIYAVAVNVSSVALLFNSAVSQVMFAIEAGAPSPTRVGRAARLTTLVTALVAAFLIAISPWMVPLVFGHDFAPAVPVIAVLLVEIALAIPGSVAGAVLSARGRPGLRSLSLAISTVFYVIAMLILVPPYGALGAALAMVAGTMLPGYLNIYLVHKYCGVELSEFYRFKASDISLRRRPLGRIR